MTVRNLTINSRLCYFQVTVADPGMVSVWTAWSRWSACTTTCGQGSRMRHRDCVGEVRGRLVRLEKQTCHGEKVEHVTCTDRVRIDEYYINITPYKQARLISHHINKPV